MRLVIPRKQVPRVEQMMLVEQLKKQEPKLGCLLDLRMLEGLQMKREPNLRREEPKVQQKKLVGRQKRPEEHQTKLELRLGC
jgi:hypothetical protein